MLQNNAHRTAVYEYQAFSTNIEECRR